MLSIGHVGSLSWHKRALSPVLSNPARGISILAKARPPSCAVDRTCGISILAPRFTRQHDDVAYLARASLALVSRRRVPPSPSTPARFACLFACRPRRAACVLVPRVSGVGLDTCLDAVGISRFVRHCDGVAYLSRVSFAPVSLRRAPPSPLTLARFACPRLSATPALLALRSLAPLAVGLDTCLGAVIISRFARQHGGVEVLIHASLALVSRRRAPPSLSTLARLTCLFTCPTPRIAWVLVPCVSRDGTRRVFRHRQTLTSLVTTTAFGVSREPSVCAPLAVDTRSLRLSLRLSVTAALLAFLVPCVSRWGTRHMYRRRRYLSHRSSARRRYTSLSRVSRAREPSACAPLAVGARSLRLSLRLSATAT